MSLPVAYLNGRYLPATELAIPLDDPGFVWGTIVTDRLRTFDGRPFRLDEHLSRFRRSCDLARVPQPREDAELATVTDRLIADNRSGGDLSIIWLATPGPTLVAYTQPFDQGRIARLRGSGAALVSCRVGTGADPRIKHRSRLAWWIATRDAREHDPDAEPLFLDPVTDNVLETPTANLVAVVDGVVTSPPIAIVLEGVSLGVVRELCQAHSIAFAERPLTLADLGRASEVLLTNTTYCIAAVSRIDDQPVPFPGPILNRLLDAWTELVGVDVRAAARS